MFENSLLLIAVNLGAGTIAIYLLSVLFRFALLGRSGSTSQQLLVVLLTGVVAIGFRGFGDGTSGFVNRITNPPELQWIVLYSLSTLIVGYLVWRNAHRKAPVASERPKPAGLAGRVIALLFTVPIIAIGLGNDAGSIYRVALHGYSQGESRLGGSRAKLREIMLNGEMASLWQMVDKEAPADLDRIIERIFANEDRYQDADDVRRRLERELGRYRVSLAGYAPALTDEQRKEVIQSSADLLKALTDHPDLCLSVATTGIQNLSQEQLRLVVDPLIHASTVAIGHLIAARQTASGEMRAPASASDDEFLKFARRMLDSGMSHEKLQAVVSGDTSHPQYCDATIGYLEAAFGLDGPAGNSVRTEIVQNMLTGAP